MVAMGNELSWIQKLKLKISGRVYIEHQKRPRWNNPLPFYAFRCPEHGIVIDYPHGFNSRLDCPECEFRLFGRAR